MTQTSLPMNFTNARIEPSKLWATVWVRGERGTVVGYDAESYEVPMTRVLFSDGRQGLFTHAEMGLKV